MGFQNMCKSHRGTLGINHFDSFTFLETPFFTTLFSYDLSAKCKQKSKHLRISSEKRKQERFSTEILYKVWKKIIEMVDSCDLKCSTVIPKNLRNSIFLVWQKVRQNFIFDNKLLIHEKTINFCQILNSPS